ncbi:MAG: 30S ribosomal protein S11 [Gammaproteobacteria bacterium]
MAKVTKTAKKKIKRTVEMAQAHVLATFNNTIITFTDPKGNKLTSASGGSIGFKGAKKATPFAAQRAVEKAAEDAKELYGVDKIEVRVKGPGGGRDAAVRALASVGLYIKAIFDVTPIAHGGCRGKGQRRV